MGGSIFFVLLFFQMFFLFFVLFFFLLFLFVFCCFSRVFFTFRNSASLFGWEDFLNIVVVGFIDMLFICTCILSHATPMPNHIGANMMFELSCYVLWHHTLFMLYVILGLYCALKGWLPWPHCLDIISTPTAPLPHWCLDPPHSHYSFPQPLPLPFFQQLILLYSALGD